MSSREVEDFYSLTPTSASRKAAPRVQSSSGNYVVSLRKPTAVTHSCYGHFTGPKEQNLVICKVSLVSIYLMTENGLEHLREFPMYGRVVFMELSHLNNLRKDVLFIATETEKLCMFDWDVQTSNVFSLDTIQYVPNLEMYQIEDESYEYYDFCQGGTIFDGKTIVLYSRKNRLRIVNIADSGQGDSQFTKTLSSTNIVDVKFLKSYLRPGLALLYRGIDGNFFSGIFEITTDDVVAIRLFQLDQTIMPTLLIPNLFSYLIIGKKGVVYYSDNEIKTKLMGSLDIQTYGRVEETRHMCRYILGGHDGHISVLEIKINTAERLSGLTFKPLGKISVPSSITYLRDDIVFVGSRYADSQLVKMHQLHGPSLNTNTPALQVLTTYTNSGPVIDFSLCNKPIGVRKLVMCCGTHEDSSLEGVSTGVGISVKFFAEIPNIQRIWSLKSSSLNDNHPFLVLQPIAVAPALVFTIDDTGAFMSHTMVGFAYDSVTICCHDAADRLFIQVTEKSVRLIDSKTGVLRSEWLASSKILFASATIKQVLLATLDKQLVYLDIRNGILVQAKVQKGYDVSCLDIGPVGSNTTYSKLAAVGLWEKSILVLKLPELEVLTVEHVHAHVPRCILLCAFEQVSYLLCALADGSLLTFKLNEDDGQLQEKNTKELEGYPKTLRTFISNGSVRACFSTSKVPTLIFTMKQKLQYNRLNLTDIEDMCPFQRADISEGLAIVTKDGVVICTMGDMETNIKIPMFSYGRRLCHQEESQTYAVLVEEKDGRHSLQLLDKELNTLFSFELNEHEHGLSIVSCSFAGDDQAYYCVGTSVNVLDEENTQGRILVFLVRDGELNIIFQYPTNGAVYYLKPLNGGLLVTVSVHTIHYFEWMLHDDARELHSINPEVVGIEDGGWEQRFAVTSSRIQKYELHDVDVNIEPPELMMDNTAMIMLQNESYFYADGLYSIHSADGVNDHGYPNTVGQWYLGQSITHMKAGTLSRLSDEDSAIVPSVMFSTVSGAVGMIVSLPPVIYEFLHKLEQYMREQIRGIGCPNEDFPRMCVELQSLSESTEFLDGDFIESFQILDIDDQEEVAEEMEVTVEDIRKIVEYLKLLH